MPNLIIQSAFLDQNADQSAFIDYDALNNVTLDYQSEWDAIGNGTHAISSMLENEPDTIQSTRIQWGNTTNGVALTGSGLNQLENIEQLEAALENGTASGAFDALTFYSNGNVIGALTFTNSAISLSTGNQVLSFTGDVPRSFQQLNDFIGQMPILSNFRTASAAEMNAFFDVMADFDLDTFSISDNGETLFGVTISSNSLVISMGGAELRVNGTMPSGNLGDLLKVVYELEMDNIDSLDELSNFGVAGATFTDRNGVVQAEITGAITDLRSTVFDTVTVQGTSGADTDIEVPLFFDEEADQINVVLGEGDDSVVLYEASLWFDDIAATFIDLGGDGGTIVISDYESSRILVDFGNGSISSETSFSGGLRNNVGFRPNARIEADIDGQLEVQGDQNDNFVALSGTINDVTYSGGAGFDVLDLSGVGITASSIQNLASLISFDGDILEIGYNLGAFRNGGTFHLDGIERVALRGENGGRELYSFEEFFNLVAENYTLGSDANDVLQGRAPAQGIVDVQILAGLDGDDKLYGDGFQAAYNPEIANQVFRLYQATLKREPDKGGHNDWTLKIASGELTLLDAARGFVRSQEFQNDYGNLDNTQFVELLYLNVLGRSADSAGLTNWVGQLDAGVTQQQVVLGFSQSQEFQINTAAAATEYALHNDPASWADDVYRLYHATLDRSPDLGGFQTWTEGLSTNQSLLDVARGFVRSQEFQNTYGSLDDTQFVELLYDNVLDRVADANGLANWVGQLDGGATRQQIVLGFSQSQEFVRATEAGLKQWMLDNFDLGSEPNQRISGLVGDNDSLFGGAGNNVLAGGILRDVFNFDADIDSTNRVLDMEPWDVLRFEDFGYTGRADAEAHMTQVGRDIVFEDQGVSVVVQGMQMADLADDMFMFV